jgi:hypothetical protein
MSPSLKSLSENRPQPLHHRLVGLLAAEVEERFIRLRAQEADARPAQAIVIGDAVMDALLAP